MSDPQHHDALIKTPKQLIITVLAAFLVPIVVIALLVSYVVSGRKTGAGSEAMTKQSISERIAPVARLELVDATAPRAMKSGEEVFKGTCTTCHTSGVAGAPKVGDNAAWAPRIAQGEATLFDHAIKGFQGKSGAMPAKGGNTDLADFEVERAVVYMANLSGGKLAEPPAPAKAAAAAAPPAPAIPQADPKVVATIAAINAGKPASGVTTPAAPVPAAAGAGDAAGKTLYDTTCVACHGAGVAGAPKFGDKAAWAPRIAEGLDTLYSHAINGFQGKSGVMPPKGGSSAPDEDVKAAVRYMTAAAK